MTKADIRLPSGAVFEKSKYVLGADLNRRGADETAFVVLEQLPFGDTNIFVSYLETQNFSKLTETIGRILHLHSVFNFDKIYIDATGLGSGVCDVLKEKIGGGIVEEIIFTSKSKPEMFVNLQLLMQQGKMKIPDYIQMNNALAKKLYFQFLSILREYKGDSEVPRVYHEKGKHDDLVCSLALAALYFQPHKTRRKGYNISGQITI